MARESNINAQDARYNTLLHYLAENSSMRLIQGALERWPHVNFNLINDRGQFPYNILTIRKDIGHPAAYKIRPSPAPELPSRPRSVEEIMAGEAIVPDVVVRGAGGVEFRVDQDLYATQSGAFQQLFLTAPLELFHDGKTAVWSMPDLDGSVMSELFVPFIERDETPSFSSFVLGFDDENAATMRIVLQMLQVVELYQVHGLLHWIQVWIIERLEELSVETERLVHDDYIPLGLLVLDFVIEHEKFVYAPLYHYMEWFFNRYMLNMLFSDELAVYVEQATRPGALDLIRWYPFLPTVVEHKSILPFMI